MTFFSFDNEMVLFVMSFCSVYWNLNSFHCRIFSGDRRDDFAHMNELENIRHIQSNKINNNSLSEHQHQKNLYH